MGGLCMDRVRFIAMRRTVESELDAQALFANLTDGGDRPGCVLLQSSDNIPKYGERSLAAVGASVRVEGRGSNFTVAGLDGRGRVLLPTLVDRLGTLCQVKRGDDDTLFGTLEPDHATVSAYERPFRRNHMDVIRTLAYCGEGDGGAALPTHALFGAIAYTFVHQYEDLARNANDALDEPDYRVYLATRMFMIDHAAHRTHFVSSVPVVSDADLAGMLLEAENDIEEMDRTASEAVALTAQPWSTGDVTSDTDKGSFCAQVESIKQDISQGRIFQAVYGRTLSTPFGGRSFDVYCKLSEINPSPYMFYMRDEVGALLAASPEMAVRVTNETGGTRVEVRPIAGTKPRGIVDGKIDALTDAKYETALKIDPKELAEHTMLVDLARNDVSSVCKAGTTVVDEPFIVEKYSHVQHLVSNVTGLLRDDLDALHAYLATMNMGTVTGAPKLEAMKMINAMEASSRGFFGGSVGYVTPDGQMDTALVIRAIRFKDGNAYVRVAAGIVADSIAENEWRETEAKAAACLRCLKEHQR